jgi:hypothetical protein
MRILRPIVETPTDLVPIGRADFIHRRRIGPKSIGDDDPWPLEFLHKPLQKLQRRGLVSLRRDHRLGYESGDLAVRQCLLKRDGSNPSRKIVSLLIDNAP